MIAQTLGTKVLNMGGQILLAWLLVPQDFGLIGLAYTVTAFISVLQNAGLQEILIHRHAHFKRWANPVFWLSLCLGVGGMILTLASIPLATRVYDAPQLAGLLAILSINAVVGSLVVVPKSRLSNELRFKALAAIGVISAACNITLACLLAWAGWGAYAIAVGTTAGVIVNVALLWKVAPVRLKRSPQARRWRFIMGDSAAILATGVLLVVISQGDYVALGLFHDAAVVGLYFFAFNLSMQTITLFTSNLGQVLFPSLAKLQNEPQRQTQAFLKAARLLALVVVPACFFQAAIADPVIRLIFPATWYGSIPVLQILCVGMAFRAVGWPGGAMMQSQGRFRALLFVAGVYGLTYILLVGFGAYVGGIVTVAFAESVFFLFFGPIQLYISIHVSGGSWIDVFRVYMPSVVGTIIALVPGTILTNWLLVDRLHVLRLIIILATVFPLYIVLMKLIAERDLMDLCHRITGSLRLRNDAKAVATT